MSRSKDVHVVPNDGRWAVKPEGQPHPLSVHDRQSDAIAAAKPIAIVNRSELVIHGRDGRIRDSDSYGNDPHPPRDKKH